MSKRRRPPKKERAVPRDLSKPIEALTWTVGDEEHFTRLDHFLMARLTWRSRTSIVGLLKEGKVQRNDEPISKKGFRLRRGDVIAVEVPPPEEEERHEEIGLQLVEAVLFEDEHLIALAKPPGLVVHPAGRVRVNTMIQALHWACLHGPLKEEGRRPDQVPRICHRLDKDTSGVIVLAKTLRARTALQHAFDAHDQLEKDYRGVVVGAPEGDSGRIDAAIGPDEEAEVALTQTIREDGLPSSTSWAVAHRAQGLAEMTFRIHTGRQHQIRVHCARGLKTPILCDPLYGDGAPLRWPEDEPLIERQALHAERMALLHPITDAPLELRAPIPEDLSAVIARLRS